MSRRRILIALGAVALVAVVVIGRGIDISMIAALAVPSGLLLQLVSNGHSLASAALRAGGLSLVFGLVNGWRIAYAEVPSRFTTLATSGMRRPGMARAENCSRASGTDSVWNGGNSARSASSTWICGSTVIGVSSR